ncbi:hypothetical protein ALC57_08274, partial [Trachymyrmex cornetzi]
DSDNLIIETLDADYKDIDSLHNLDVMRCGKHIKNCALQNVFKIHNWCIKRRAVRLLSRRYDLTDTGYKYLEIGINVGPPSYVEIALGDHRGHELSLSLETWKGLYEQRWNIYKMLRNEYKDNFISIGPLTEFALVRLVDTVDVKYTRFSNIVSKDAIRDSDIFNRHHLVDCELLALVFNTYEK